MHAGYHLLVLLDLVEPLLHGLETRLAQRFRADQQAGAPGFCGEIDQIRVPHDRRADLRHPVQASSGKCTEQLAAIAGIAGDVVIDEEILRRSRILDLLDDMGYGFHADGLPEEPRHAAELAAERTAPGGEYRHHRQLRPDAPGIGPQVQVVPLRKNEPLKVGEFRVLIEVLESVVLAIAQDLFPDVVRFADDHGIGMLSCFLRQYGRMHASHDDRDAALSKGIRNLIGPLDLHGHGRDRHQVIRDREVDFVHDVVDDPDIMMIRREAIEGGQGQGWEVTPPVLDRPSRRIQSRWVYEQDVHFGKSPLPFRCHHGLRFGRRKDRGKASAVEARKVLRGSV